MIDKLRDPLFRIVADGTTQIKDDIGERYQRECAFWFQFGGLMLISHAYLLRNYCEATKKGPPKWFGWYLTTLSVVGVVVMPESGFWVVLAQGLWMIFQN